MSRTIKLVLLGGVMLTTCCCFLNQRNEPQYDENGNPIPPEQRTTSYGSGYRRSWFGLPFIWSSGSRSYRGSGGWSSGVSRPGGASSVKTGGFGSSAAKFGGGGISS
jgi:hypothetical protein